MGSREPLALDLAVCRMFGLSPAMVPTLKIADDMGFLPQDWHIDGPLPEIHDFRLPDMASLIFGPPSLQRLSRLYLLQRPAADMTACKLCGECVKICPAKAVIRRESADDGLGRADLDAFAAEFAGRHICRRSLEKVQSA